MEYFLNELLLKTNSPDVHTLLLKPVKHVLKYPDVLSELIRNEDRSNGLYDDLSKALICMQDVVLHVNDIQRKYELSTDFRFFIINFFLI